MAKVLWHVTMSLDGFTAATDGSLSWMLGHGSAGPVADEVIARTGAILSGRRGFDVGQREGYGAEAVYGGAWSGPIFVLTHHPTTSAEGFTFIGGPIDEAVDTARRAAGGRDVGIFGADVARQCLAAGLLDEVVVHVVPVLLGSGVRMFDSADTPPVTLTKLRRDDAATDSHITDLSFAVVR